MLVLQGSCDSLALYMHAFPLLPSPLSLSLSQNHGFSTCIFIMERVLACFRINAPVLQDASSCLRGGQRLVSDGEISQSGRSRRANMALFTQTSMGDLSPSCSWTLRLKQEPVSDWGWQCIHHANQHNNLINMSVLAFSLYFWIYLWVSNPC